MRALNVLKSVDTVVGYTTYTDLLAPVIQGKKVYSTSMTKEVQRVELSIDVAMKKQSCALVSSGDSGIYAMCGLVFEICKKKNISIITSNTENKDEHKKDLLKIEIIPGIPALCSGASLLGAPLIHDFAVISLSDLLTPWSVIEQRLKAAAEADFVIVLYNPKSKKRNWQLKKAQEVILEYRNENTPVGIVTSAMRKEQKTSIVPLADLHKAFVNMQSTVFVGNSVTTTYNDFMITPRGYFSKYDIGEKTKPL